MTKRFAYIWEYSIKPARRAEFLSAYCADGTWAELFSRDPGYIETILLADDRDENRYVTIDFWLTREDRDAFRLKHADAFARLDRLCEEFTERETFVGDFAEVDVGNTERTRE